MWLDEDIFKSHWWDWKGIRMDIIDIEDMKARIPLACINKKETNNMFWLIQQKNNKKSEIVGTQLIVNLLNSYG